MNSIIIDILPLLLMVMLFWGAKLKKPLSSLNTENYLTYDTSKYYRGFFAIVVVFHHLSKCTETGIVFPFFYYSGYLAVSYFFFLSGYGLQKSYIVKADHYRKGFLLKRIPSVLIPYIITIVFYWLLELTRDNHLSLKSYVYAILHGRTILGLSWYIITILIFYVIYWLLMVICSNRYFLMITLAVIWYIFYMIFCIKMGYGGYWFNATPLLIVGMFWATYESNILELLTKIHISIVPAIWISFTGLFLIEIRNASFFNLSNLIKTLIIAVLFVLGVLMFSLEVQIGNRALEFLGNISLEIYLSQGIFIEILSNRCVYFTNELLLCITVLSGTIIFSYLLHIILQFILKKYRIMLHNLKV